MADNTEPTIVPTEITLGDQTYSVAATPALQDLVKAATIKAQSTEKNKLYPQIKELRDKLTALETGSVRVPGSPTIDPEDRLRNEEFRQFMNKMNERTPELNKEEIQNMISEAFKTQLGPLLNQTIAPIQSELENTKKEQTKQYLDRRLAELGDTVIPELVSGSTVAEIEASIELSKGVYTRTKGTPAPGIPAPGAPAPGTPAMFVPGTTQAVATPPPSGPHMTPDGAVPNIKRMSAEEFAAQRGELAKTLRNFATEYPTMNMEPVGQQA